MDRQSMQERFGIVGSSEGIRHVLDRVRLIAGTGITALIEGESGVGKELIAQAIHELSTRRHKKMLIVNCGAIPEGLIESELFGAEKGAYTGAVERRSGYFEEANGSTIFLDEIGEMPLTAQVRLLRVLEIGEFSRVGSSNVLRTDVRVIAATNKDLAREVEAGRFREDLYYRLSTVIIRVPPLRERRDDILPIFEHLQHRFAQKYNTAGPRLQDSARELFLRYRWPGNIRELRNVAEQTVVLLGKSELSADDVRPLLRGVGSAGGGVGLVRASEARDRDSFTGEVGEGGKEREIIYRTLLELRTDVADMGQHIRSLTQLMRGRTDASTASMEEDEAGRAPGRYLMMPPAREDADGEGRMIEDVPYELDGDSDAGPGSSTADEEPLPTLEEAEHRLIQQALNRFEGNRRQSAEALGISERTLYRKIKDYEGGARE
ncbi:MAG: sigma-54-dependent Fis family transcriptional regulator [Bacteroidetes bacterium CG12_big_fil_rev_8_21_14_0_65_60_17]|nr:MAG: sigma-54-dependent Fis family transcriptional regulator [Bacteroidetes bacterium CG12_big_fil_rev_8_21_14_0_65_60_17]